MGEDRLEGPEVSALHGVVVPINGTEMEGATPQAPAGRSGLHQRKGGADVSHHLQPAGTGLFRDRVLQRRVEGKGHIPTLTAQLELGHIAANVQQLEVLAEQMVLPGVDTNNAGNGNRRVIGAHGVDGINNGFKSSQSFRVCRQVPQHAVGIQRIREEICLDLQAE